MLMPLYTKKDVLEDISYVLEQFLMNGKYNCVHEEVYYEEIEKVILVFKDKVNEAVLIEPLPSGWHYDWTISSYSVELYVSHCVTVNERSMPMVDQQYVLIQVPVKMLTATELAQRYQVKEKTVIQWIRRGRIRTAYKMGSVWRISILTEKPTIRGYTDAVYEITGYLDDVPKKFHSLLEDCRIVRIFRDKKDSALFHVRCMKAGGDDYVREIVLDTAEREEFEIALIAAPDIRYIQDVTETIEYAVYQMSGFFGKGDTGNIIKKNGGTLA